MCYGYDGNAALEESLARRGTTRRGLLRGAAASVAGAAVVGAVGTAPASAGARRNTWKRVPPGKISIQLYTLREIMTGSGVDSTLAALAADGYPKVELAGLCGSDLHPYRGAEGGLDSGTTMGHELTGRVVAVGDEVRRFRSGDLVLSPFSTSCGGMACSSMR